MIPDAKKNETYITVQGLSGTKPREVSVGFIAEVLNARAEELIAVVKEVVTEKNLQLDITGGYVLTGGGSLIRHLPEMAEYVLEKPVKLGYPLPFGGMTTVMQHPKFSTVLGLLQEGVTTGAQAIANEEEKNENDMFDKIGKSLKNAFKELF